ncbi:MAG: 1-acyl-sn-glycerol-3-phosphate acyltransferase [Polyangiaceae bacterium]
MSSLPPGTTRTLVSYEPNPILAWLYHRFFEHVEVDEAWVSAVRSADQRGTVIYALRNLSFVDFFALDYLTKRFMLPQVRFANDLGLWVLEPMGRGWLRALQPHDEARDAADLQRAVVEGSSAALFLKRPAGLGSGARRGKIEGDPYLRALFDAQRSQERPILIVPQVFVWSKRPDQARHTIVDSLLGPREWPGKVRTVAQFLANYRDVALRAGEPVDVKQFLAQAESNGDSGSSPSDDVLVRKLTYTLLRRLERERRAVIGPTMKPGDRLREEVIRSPKLQKIIADMAGQGDAERQVITTRALSMLREMEAAPDMGAVTAIKPAFQTAMARMYSAMEVDEPGLARVGTAMKDGSIVLLPSHKSHLDYMLLTHVFLTHHLQLPLIAAGDNLNFFPLGAVFRRAGAFFIRRSFGTDRLYGAVVDAYVRRLIKDGWTLEFFLEGGRSRTGKLLSPKVGLLSLVVDAALGVERPVYFVPISIGYERVVEEKAFVSELTGGEKRPEDMRGLLASANAIAQRYGRLNIQFGEILTLPSVLGEIDPQAKLGGDAKLTPAKRRALVTRLAYRAMNEINRVTAVTPGALVATALLTHGKRGIAHADLEQSCVRIASILHGFGARFAPSLAHPQSPGGIRLEAVREACDLFVRAGNMEVRAPAGVKGTKPRAGRDAIYVVPDEARLSLDLSKNIVVHFFLSRAMIATALLAPPRTPTEAEPLRERVRALSRLFKYEFQFRADAPFEQIFEETIAAMVASGELSRKGGVIDISGGDDARANVVFYAQVVRNFVEGYRIAARGLAALLKGPLPPKDLVRRALATGERMFLAGEIERREAVSRPLFENAHGAFVDQGYLTRDDGKLRLADSFDSQAAVRTIEARIAGFLPVRE